MVNRIKSSSPQLFDLNDLASEAKQHGWKSQEADGEEVNGANLKRLFNAQGGRCYYSGKKLTKKNVSVDHRQPLSKGGRNVMSNVALCTKKVNTMKGQMTELEFVELCRAISQH